MKQGEISTRNCRREKTNQGSEFKKRGVAILQHRFQSLPTPHISVVTTPYYISCMNFEQYDELLLNTFSVVLLIHVLDACLIITVYGSNLRK
jgi:hypothetical protein